MNPVRKSNALGLGVVAILLLACAGFASSRPAPAAISLTQLEARSALDARTLSGAIPAKFPDKRMSLQGLGDLPGDLPSVITQIAGETGVSSVRLWSPSGTPLASADENDPTAATTADLPLIAAASGADARSSSVGDQAGGLRIFEPVLPGKPNAVVAEIVRSTTEGGLPFKAIGAGLGAFGVLALIIALASLRAGSGTKVAPVAADGSLPASVDEPADPEDGAPARSSVRLTQKLQTSEASRAAMETQMQQLRAQLRMGTQGSEQMMADLDRSLASSQQRVHEANEKAVLAETRASAAEQRAVTAEEALSRATPSDAADRAVALEAELAAAKGKIAELEGSAAELEGSVAEHQARTRDAEARAGESEQRVKVVAAQVAEHAALSGQAESRQRELEDRAATAEARATQVEAAARAASAPVRGPDVTALEVRASAAEESAAQLKIQLSRAQDLAEQALAKLDTSEGRVTSAEAKAEAQRRADVAERRSMVAGGAPENLSLEESQAAISAPVIEPAPPASETPVSGSDPAVPGDEEPAADTSATDPGAWKALAKSLRRNALGDEAADDEPEEEPATPAKEVSDNDRSELRARLAKASAKKRRRPE